MAVLQTRAGGPRSSATAHQVEACSSLEAAHTALVYWAGLLVEQGLAGRYGARIRHVRSGGQSWLAVCVEPH